MKTVKNTEWIEYHIYRLANRYVAEGLKTVILMAHGTRSLEWPLDTTINGYKFNRWYGE